MTRYIVLEMSGKPEEPDTWQQAGAPVDSLSPENAIRKVIGDNAMVKGKFVAIPLRSFKPMTVTVETKRTVKLA